MPHDPGGRPAISPRFVKMPATDATVAGELGTFIMNMHLIRRAGAGDDIAYLVAYLASDESSWTTGESFCIDGGVAAGYR